MRESRRCERVGGWGSGALSRVKPGRTIFAQAPLPSCTSVALPGAPLTIAEPVIVAAVAALVARLAADGRGGGPSIDSVITVLAALRLWHSQRHGYGVCLDPPPIGGDEDDAQVPAAAAAAAAADGSLALAAGLAIERALAAATDAVLSLAAAAPGDDELDPLREMVAGLACNMAAAPGAGLEAAAERCRNQGSPIPAWLARAAAQLSRLLSALLRPGHFLDSKHMSTVEAQELALTLLRAEGGRGPPLEAAAIQAWRVARGAARPAPELASRLSVWTDVGLSLLHAACASVALATMVVEDGGGDGRHARAGGGGAWASGGGGGGEGGSNNGGSDSTGNNIGGADLALALASAALVVFEPDGGDHLGDAVDVAFAEAGAPGCAPQGTRVRIAARALSVGLSFSHFRSPTR